MLRLEAELFFEFPHQAVDGLAVVAFGGLSVDDRVRGVGLPKPGGRFGRKRDGFGRTWGVVWQICCDPAVAGALWRRWGNDGGALLAKLPPEDGDQACEQNGQIQHD